MLFILSLPFHPFCLSSLFLSTPLISLSIRLMVCVVETLVVAVTDGAAADAADVS